MIIIVLLVLGLMPFAAADPLGQFCGTGGNYTSKSTYQANLELLRTILPKNTSSAPTLFAKGSVGAAPDTVYGLALCRGDANASACRDCVATAFQDAQLLCAYNKDATIFYDPCLLRFSDQDFLKASSSGDKFLILMNTQNITEPVLPGWDPGNAESVTIITDIIEGLVQNTAKLAAYNSTRMYATGCMDVSSTFPTLYSMAQCTPDLQPGDCWDCLQNINNYTTRYFPGKQGGRIIGLRCNFRYETYLFYQGQPMTYQPPVVGSSGAVVPTTYQTPFTTRSDPWFQFCGTDGNYTAKSTYQANLELLRTILPKNTSSAPTLFAKGSVGAAPDTVYGLAVCRGDANASACGDCVATAFQHAQQLCAHNKDATIFYDPCLLRFSDQDFLKANSSGRSFVIRNVQNITEPMLPGWDPGNAQSVIIITSIIKGLVENTAKKAAYNSTRMYATGRMDVSSTFPPLYSMAQCTPDLQPGDCWDCLQKINNYTTRYFSGKQGGRIFGLRCNFRYETYLFYQGQPMLQIGSSGAVVPTTNSTTNTAAPPQPPVAVPIQKHKRRMSKVLVIATAVPLLASFCCFIFCFGLIRRHIIGKVSLQDKPNVNVHEDDEALVWGIEGRSSQFTFFDFSQLSDATSNFSDENKLGQGGFGPVYKGQFPDGLEIAIKRLASHSGQGFREFKNEVQLIAKLQHTNLVRLLGCCSQGEEKILIYEYLPNKSLDFFIFDETRRALLNWNKRLAIIEGIAQGFLYLHKHSRLRVIHRDLKASNILLDREMNPKISDFGLAKIFSSNDTEGNTKRVAGTYGYMAPEYASEGLFSVKSDVFSFGVLILEIISGKRNSGFHQYGDFFTLLGYAWKLWKEERWLELVDASLVSELHALETMRCINIALLCVQENATDRPTMSDVVAMLSSESTTMPEPEHPAYFHVRVTKEEASTVAEPSSVNDVTISVLSGR